MTLPHTWNHGHGGDPADAGHRGACWYRRRLDLSAVAGGRRIVLEIGAAGMVADVHLDGVRLVHHRGGYSAFRCDLTEALGAGRRGVLAVRVDNSASDDVYPLMGDHTMFGGLYRPVRLIDLDPVHVDVLHHGGPGVTVRQLAIDDDAARIAVTVRVANASGAAVAEEVAIRVLDAAGAEVASARVPVTTDPGAVVEAAAELGIEHPRRWHGRRDPYLYRVAAEVGGDRVALPLGLRTFTVDAETGVHLNGRPYRLHGVSRHHDIAGTPAVSRAEIERDLDLIDEIGATAVRLAHYQHADDVLDLCDERGLVVWAEIPLNARVSTTDPLTNAAAQLTELIHQQRHHPSILCWGVQNEALISERVADPRPVIAELAALARRLDPDRPVAQAQVFLARPDDPINRLTDLNARNLYAGWYYGAAEDVARDLDEHHAACPDVPLGLSEYGADAHPDYHASRPEPGDYTEEYQAVLHEVYWRVIGARPWLWASFVWNMFDFASVIRDEGGTRGFNMKGLVTRDRRIRKDAFWWYKANWSDEPVLHVCARRFVNRHDPDLEIKVYSNHPEVRLVVGGEDLGAQRSADRIFRWAVRLGPGETSVVARAGDQEDRATFRLVDGPDPSYLCPAPRRRAGAASGTIASWFEGPDGAVDRTRYGTWSLLGELLDDPAAAAVLVDTFGARLLEHPMLDVARGLPLGMVLEIAGARLGEDDARALQARLYRLERPPPPASS